GNYVLQQFGNPAVRITPEQVAQLRAGGEKPWLIASLPYVFWGGVLLGLIVIGAWVKRRVKR
ncbi:cytochrome c, partial [Serratia marcescens]